MKDEYLKTYKWMNSLKGGVLRDVYALLHQLGQRGEAKVTIAYICERLGYQTRQVQRAISELKETGMLEVQYKDGESSVFKTQGGVKSDTPVKNDTPVKSDTPVKNDTPVKSDTTPMSKMTPPTPYLYLDKNIDNIVVVEEKGARAENLAKDSGKKLLTKWVMDNEEGLTQVLLRAGLITSSKTTTELQAIIEPYINEYYLQIQMTGEEDIERRGRSDVKTHFARWIKKRVQAEKQELNKQSNGNNSNQTSTQRVANLEDIAQSILAGCQAGRASRQ